MKKVLVILALALFIGGISVPAIAASNNISSVVLLNEEDPKKDEVENSTESTTKSTESTTKSSDCTKSEKSESDCSKKCEDKS